MLIADRDNGLAGLLAAGVAPISLAILAVGDVDPTTDELFLDRLYIPGLRRAGDLTTAASMASGTIVIHDAGTRFALSGATVERRVLSAAEIVGRITAQTKTEARR